MARKPRLHVPGGVYHVILRGNARQDIFFADGDRSRFYSLLEEGVARFGYRVHGFCLMRNHVHLAVQAGETPLSRALQNLAFRYARHINHSQARIGHVFQGRYHALLVDAESYLLELVRYIHLNPVRARVVNDPAAYSHSGHLGYLDRKRFGFLTTGWVLSHFDESVDAARRQYARFVAQGVGEGHRADLYRGTSEIRVLGVDRFIERATKSVGERASRVPTLDCIVAEICKRLELSEPELRAPGKRRDSSHARAVIGWLAMRAGAASLAVVAQRFRRDPSTLSRAVIALERVAAADGAEAKRLRAYQNAITQA